MYNKQYMSNHGLLTKDGIFNNLQIRNKVVIDKTRSAQLKDLKVAGATIMKGGLTVNGNSKITNLEVNNLTITGEITGGNSVSNGWTTVLIPDTDNDDWVPVDQTHYTQLSLTSPRTLTLTQANLETSYPNAPLGTIITFDFPVPFTSDLNLILELTVSGIYNATALFGTVTFDRLHFMRDCYVMKIKDGTSDNWRFWAGSVNSYEP